MLSKIIKALDSPNGVTEEDWIYILSIMGDKVYSDIQAHGFIQSYGGRYYLTNIQIEDIKRAIFLVREDKTQPMLALPPHIEISHPDNIRCGHCNGPFHPATGHAFNATLVACGPCYGRFAAWQLKKYGWTPLTYKALKKMDRQKARKEKIALKIQEAVQKRIANEDDGWRRFSKMINL